MIIELINKLWSSTNSLQSIKLSHETFSSRAIAEDKVKTPKNIYQTSKNELIQAISLANLQMLPCRITTASKRLSTYGNKLFFPKKPSLIMLLILYGYGEFLAYGKSKQLSGWIRRRHLCWLGLQIYLPVGEVPLLHDTLVTLPTPISKGLSWWASSAHNPCLLQNNAPWS